MRFRYHRGLLAESMKTLIEVSSDAHEFIAKINSDHVGMFPSLLPWRVEDISMKNQGPDDRIGWQESWLVHLKGFGVIGMCDQKLAGLEQDQHSLQCNGDCQSKSIQEKLANALLEAQLNKPKELVTGTSNWAHYMACKVIEANNPTENTEGPCSI